MSSSLARARSLRTKPAAPPSRASATADATSGPRNPSPVRLPVKQPVKHNVRTVSAASSSSSSSTSMRMTRSATAAAAAAVSSRAPISGVSGRIPSARLPSGGARDAPVRKDTTSSRYPPSTTLTRPPVQMRPRSSGPTTTTMTMTTTTTTTQPVKKAPVHTRSRSTVTTLTSATALRPPLVREPQASRSGTPTTASRSGTSSAAGRSGTPTTTAGRSGTLTAAGRSGTPTTAGRSGTPTTTTTTGRTLHRRTGSIDKRIVAPKPQPPPPPQASKLAAPAPAAAAPSQPKVRPAFSTLQQHYSPAKSLAPKPLTSTFLAPPSPSKLPANVAASAEVSKLQAELLQLHLLHRDAATVDVQWRASAKGKLGERFAKLCESSREVAEQERVGVERQNVLALRRWGGGGGGLDDKIQSLEAVVTGVWSLSDSGGRYARVVRRFERWIDCVCEIEDARRKGTGLLLQGQHTLFIGELDDSWKDDREGLIRRLDGWRRQLHEIDHLPNDDDEANGAGEKSSLARMLEGSRDLIDDMLAELNLMEEIEQEALAREDEWIGRMNRDEDGDEDTPRAGAVWRVV